MSKFQIIFVHMQYKSQVFDNASANFNANLLVGNLQLSIGKLQLPPLPQLF